MSYRKAEKVNDINQKNKIYYYDPQWEWHFVSLHIHHPIYRLILPMVLKSHILLIGLNVLGTFEDFLKQNTSFLGIFNMIAQKLGVILESPLEFLTTLRIDFNGYLSHIHFTPLSFPNSITRSMI